MDKQLNKLTKLINDLLDISRAKDGKMRYTDESFDLAKLVKEVTRNFSNTTQRKIIVKTSLKRNAYGDAERISQVVSNIIENAIKYSKKTAEIIVTVAQDGDNALVSIQDSGIGIAKKHQDKIFKRFFRVYENEDKTFPGMGAGLFISAEIIKRHHGKMWVKSKKGEGATFYFSFPLDAKMLLN
jgi:signal transduction histidine kinase